MEFLGMDFSCAFGSLSQGEFPEKDCLLPLISKLLGYCIVAASTTVKVPQILKILQHKSVRGLSVIAFELEVIGYTIALAYCLHKGLPFSAYGELAFLLIQAIILVAIIYYFSQPIAMKTWIRALLYSALAPTILAGRIDPILFEALYASQHAIFFCARVPQIWENYKNKSTGELSFLTSLMNFAGSMGECPSFFLYAVQERTLDSTSLEQVKKHMFLPKVLFHVAFDKFSCILICKSICFSLEKFDFLDLCKVIMGSVIGIVTNGTILSQIITYQKPPAKKGKKAN
ncbi:hypothetical protein RJ640_012018 [Escallonia rubra]|uniref:Mannose-P-dolichol utilization defect 1 protein homolog n=1 Tax=Escallonia rubra TaxID=112253 RepID=A0AA88R8G6_9ASTE|nr:hypothetical protein RJ640_012018 [Escallonia rubra]